MIYEAFKLNTAEECSYNSYALTLTVGDLMQTSHSSNIQRTRNEEKEKGIMKFIKNHIDNRKTPYFQPFILHYNGRILSNEGKYILDPKPQFEVEIEDENGETIHKLFEFEVLDGNGRLNALIRLQQYYIDKIHSLNLEYKDESTNEKRKKRIQKKIEEFKDKNKRLKDTEVAVQLYLNLSDKEKATLFNSVNQGESMSKGRLEIYSDKGKPETELLHDYILHTSNSSFFDYTITVDKDIVRSDKDRKELIPAVFLTPTFKKIVKYYKTIGQENYKEDAFNAIDKYIMGVSNYKMLRKQYFSILGSVIEEASQYEENLSTFTEKMSQFNLDNLSEEASRRIKEARKEILDFVFNGATKKNIDLPESEQTVNIV